MTLSEIFTRTYRRSVIYLTVVLSIIFVSVLFAMLHFKNTYSCEIARKTFEPLVSPVSRENLLGDTDVVQSILQNAVRSLSNVRIVATAKIRQMSADGNCRNGFYSTTLSLPLLLNLGAPLAIVITIKHIELVYATLAFILVLLFSAVFFVLLNRKFLRVVNDNILHPIVRLSKGETLGSSVAQELIEVSANLDRLQESRAEILVVSAELKWREQLLLESRRMMHDLKGPLTSIKVGVDRFAERPEDCMDLLKKSYLRVNEILERYLQFTSNKALRFKFEDVPLKLICDHIKSAIEPFHQDCLRIEFKSEACKGAIRIDRLWFERILMNLVKNSVEAIGHRDGAISVLLTAPNTNARIQIIDNGPGMPESVLKKILGGVFTTKSGGNGLGVSTAREVISEWNGKFSVESTMGAGTVVTIDLPIV